MINPQYIKLNMIPSGVMPTLYCSQYDVGRPLGLVVYNGNDSVNLSGYTCTIEATRTDKTPVTVAVTTSDNIGVFATTATMTNQADTFRGKLVLVDGNNKRVASLAFVLCVTAKTMDENAEQIQEDASLYQQYNGAVQAMLADIRDRLTIEKRDRISNDTLLQNQIDDLIAPSGEAPSAAEVENARIGWDGTRYQTLGTAIRTQVKNLQDEINGITTHVNLNPTWENGNISTDNGTEFTADNYIRTGYIRMLSEYLRVFLPSDLTHSVDVLVYSGTTAASYTGTYHHISGTYSGIIVKVPLNSYCRFVFWDSNAATPSASAVTINQLYSTDVTLTQAGKPADAKVTGDRIGNLNQLITEDHSSLVAAINEIGMGGGTGLSDDAKLALLACFQKVAWIDDDGQDYYDTLHDALFPTAVSISATFTPGSHVFYETDSLDDLRPYLVVRATMPDSTVEVVTDYFLTGSMAVGTNTITVLYQGLTDTFTVTTVADPAYIEAVFTQPQTTIYTDDSLDSLKSNLVVTYYSAPGATGTVLANSAYTLVGTLTEGTSVITAEYQGLTDTFEVTVVDFYNIHTWSMSIGNLEKAVGSVDPNMSDTAKYPSRITYRADVAARRTYLVTKGKAPCYTFNQTEVPSPYYPIPVPPNANHIKITMTPAGQYIYANFPPYDPATGQYQDATATDRILWTQLTNGVLEKNITTNNGHLFMAMNSKYDSAGTSYPVEPTNMVIEFSEV